MVKTDLVMCVVRSAACTTITTTGHYESCVCPCHFASVVLLHAPPWPIIHSARCCALNETTHSETLFTACWLQGRRPTHTLGHTVAKPVISELVSQWCNTWPPCTALLFRHCGVAAILCLFHPIGHHHLPQCVCVHVSLMTLLVANWYFKLKMKSLLKSLMRHSMWYYTS